MSTILLIIALVGAIPLCAEMMARVYLRCSRYYPHVPNKLTTITPHPEILPSLEREVRFETNELGERGAPIPKGDDVFKVLCAGGSSMECLFLDQDSATDGRLAALLPELPALSGCQVHVGNIGKSLIDTVSLYQMFEKTLKNYDQLDLVILQVGASDVVRWLEKSAPADGSMSEKRLDDVFAWHPETSFALNLKQLAARKLLGRWKATKPARYENSGRRYREIREMRRNAKTTITAMPDFTGFNAALKENYAALLDQLSAPGRIVLVVRQAWFGKEEYSDEELAVFWHGAAGNGFREQVDTFYSPEVFAESMRQADKTIAALCEERGVPHLGLKEIVPSDLTYLYDQLHVTKAGADLVARAITEKVEEELQPPMMMAAE